MFCIYILAILLFGSFHIGPFTIRVYATIIMMAVLIYKWNNYNLTISLKYIKIFIIFIFISFLSKLLGQGISSYEISEIDPFFKRCFANYLPAIITFISIGKFIKTPKQLNNILITLICIAVLNAITSYLQSKGNLVGVTIGRLFSNNENTSLDYINDKINEINSLFIPVPGIFGHPAINGYMTACLGVLPLMYIFKKKEKYRLFYIGLLIICLVGSFASQERSSLGLFIIFTMITLVKFKPNKIEKYFFMIIPLLIILFFIDLDNLNSIEIGRFSKMGEIGEDRVDLYSESFNFIPENILFGGDAIYNHYYVTPHNFFIHAFIYSGIFGALILIYLYFLIIYECYKIIKDNPVYNFSYIFSISLSIYMLNGIFHSASLITGDIYIWLSLGLMLQSYHINNNIKRNENFILFQGL